MHRGFAKQYRKIVDWCWYSDPVPRGIMMHLILVANIKDKQWRNITVKQGQLITSVKGLADKLGFSVRQIRTGLDKLKSTGEISVKTTNKYTLITLINWHTYNNCGYGDDKQMTNERQTNDKQMTTTKEVKKEENINTTAEAVDFGKPKVPICPHKKIIDLYHEILPELRRVKIWGDKRQQWLQARWREEPARQTLDYWRNYFHCVRSSDFLMGRVAKSNFKADLEWLIKAGNFANVVEEKYANRKAANG